MVGHDLTKFLQARYPELNLNYDKTLLAVREALPYSWCASQWRSTNWNATNPDLVYISVLQEEWITNRISLVNSLDLTQTSKIRVSVEQFYAGIENMSAYVRESLRWHTRRQLAQFGYEIDLSDMTWRELIIIRSLYTQVLPFAETVFEVEDNNITIHSRVWYDKWWDFDTFSMLHESQLHNPLQSLHYTFDLQGPYMTWNAFDPIEVYTINLYKDEEPVQDWLPTIEIYNGQIIRFFDWLMPGYSADFQEFKMVWSLQ